MIKNADCHYCINTDCLIKKHIKNEYVKEILDKKHTFSCKKSQQFILEGSPMHGLYFIYKGKAKVTKTGIFGKEQIVRFAKAGEIIGHRGFGAGQKYPVGATALEDTTLCNFSHSTLIEVFHKASELTFDLMLFYASELNKSETKIRKFAQMSVREKVIDAILYVNRKFGQTENFLNLSLSRKDIADFSGTTEEQAIRVISGLRKESLIQTEGKKIGIQDVPRLKKEIDEHHYFLES